MGYCFSDTFENYLGTGFTEDTGVEPKTVIPNGLLPREYGEYRSYLQLPYIYWNKLFKIFQSKAESVTGYQFELDNTWFTSTNPYWYNQCANPQQQGIIKFSRSNVVSIFHGLLISFK